MEKRTKKVSAISNRTNVVPVITKDVAQNWNKAINIEVPLTSIVEHSIELLWDNITVINFISDD